MSELHEDHELDCKGLNCPLPILKTKKAIDGMAEGQILKMIATDPGSINDVQAFTKRTKHELMESISDNGEYIFFIRKS